MKSRSYMDSLEEIPAEEVRSHLERVLSSPQFKASKRCHRFLSYVVNEVMEGNADGLKERTLATDVFDRPSSWDSGEDTIVRGGAREVRKRLAQYYATPEGMQERIRFELAPGSYVPLFVHAESAESMELPLAAPAAAESPAPPSAKVKRAWFQRPWLLGMATTGLAAAIAAVTLTSVTPPSLFDEFWKPLWKSPDPVLIAMANPLVYHASSRAVHLNEQRLGATRLPVQRPLQLLPKELDGSDIVPVFDQYVGYGDAVAASEISGLMGRHAGSVLIRSADKMEFEDFREAPSVIIGAFTNHWMMELTDTFRFHFGRNAEGHAALLDSADPNRHWSILSKTDNGVTSDDYFLVCRLTNSPSGKIMLAAAGLSQYGTEAAGHFLTDPNRLNDVLRKIGGNWQNQNLEIVFHARVVENATSPSELVAWHVW